MSLYFSGEDKNRLLEEVPVINVIEYLGIDTKRIGSSLSILCPRPDHNDQHFGSCMLRHGKLICFVCHKQINSINLLMWCGGMSYYTAMCTLAELSGHQEDFEASKKPSQTQAKKILKLSNDEKSLIGLASISHPRAAKNVTFNRPENTEYFRDNNGDYVIIEGLGYNPWLNLAKEDTETFKWMVRNKCTEKMSDIASIAEKIQSGSDETLNKLFSDTGLERRGIILALADLYRKIEDIYQRYDGKATSLKEMREQLIIIYFDFIDIRQTA